MFQVSVVNRTRTISDLELHRVVRAINRQIEEDFAPYWGFGGRLRVDGTTTGRLDTATARELRGDAILYLLDTSTASDALGYHDRTMQGIPYGFVYLDLCAELGDPWSATLSHEALELIADPQCNLLVQGPHPGDSTLPEVYHYFEMCDAVQAQVYEIDSVVVSNFILPSYFTPGGTKGERRDFSGTGLRSFDVAPGGYIGYFDPNLKGGPGPATWFADRRSEERCAIKSRASRPGRKHPVGRVMRRSGLGVSLPQMEVADTTPATSTAGGIAGTAASDPIRHVVVLMLENRSFDQVLGGLAQSIPGLDGVNPDSPGANTDTRTETVYRQEPVARPVISATFDAPHEYSDVMEQLRDGNANFINSYVKHNLDGSQDDRQQVMAYFAEGSLPVTHELAKNFLVCNRWFSSLPGPTWPNRLFVHSGTSLGHVLMPNADNPEEIDQLWGTFTQDTIYDRLDEATAAGKPLSWRIYHDGMPQSVILDHLKIPFFRGHYFPIDRFAEDVQHESTFPSYVFIEPRYASGFLRKANDQHPPSSMLDGEKLIAWVYNAIRRSEVWNSTLLMLTYDEHGGFYDHVTPPAAVPPDTNRFPFGFDRLGVRVPAILISPWVRKGCDDSVYDHTSILRYLIGKHGLKPLGARTAPSSDPRAVADIAAQILPYPRTDTPEAMPEPQPADAAPAPPARHASQRPEEPQMAPDNTRRVLLAVGERLRALDRHAVHGALRDAGESQQPPTDPAQFAQRIDAVDDWLETRAPQKGKHPRLAAVAPAPARLKGIDVWSGNGDIDWARVKQDGVAFAYIRAAYGTDADEAALRNLEGARAAGVVCGIYHFLRSSQTQSYDRQLKVMQGLLDTLKVGPGDLPPAVDVEDNPRWDGAWKPENNADYLDALERWILAVQNRTGTRPVLYTRAGFWDELGSPGGFRASLLWVASYRPDQPRLPAGWDEYTFWQYSESGAVQGIHGNVDMNYFAGGEDDLAALVLGARAATPRAARRARGPARPPSGSA